MGTTMLQQYCSNYTVKSWGSICLSLVIFPQKIFVLICRITKYSNECDKCLCLSLMLFNTCWFQEGHLVSFMASYSLNLQITRSDTWPNIKLGSQPLIILHMATINLPRRLVWVCSGWHTHYTTPKGTFCLSISLVTSVHCTNVPSTVTLTKPREFCFMISLFSCAYDNTTKSALYGVHYDKIQQYSSLDHTSRFTLWSRFLIIAICRHKEGVLLEHVWRKWTPEATGNAIADTLTGICVFSGNIKQVECAGNRTIGRCYVFLMLYFFIAVQTTQVAWPIWIILVGQLGQSGQK